MPANLSVNVNAIAQLRNRRDLPWPDLIALSRLALNAGASGITVHPRPDQRHIRFADLPTIKSLLSSEFPGREFNIEGYPSEHFLSLVEENKPDQVTLVPDDPDQPTSDHGWDFDVSSEFLAPLIARIRDAGMRVSLFIDADPAAVAGAVACGCDGVELYTGPYGALFDNPEAAGLACERLGKTADAALAHGLYVNAGHDLTVENLPLLASRIPALAEVSIGHALTADALVHGMTETVQRFRKAAGYV